MIQAAKKWWRKIIPTWHLTGEIYVYISWFLICVGLIYCSKGSSQISVLDLAILILIIFFINTRFLVISENSLNENWITIKRGRSEDIEESYPNKK